MKTLEKVSDFVGKYMAAIVIVVAALALLFPGTFSVVKTAWVNTLLGIVMFGMGLTLKPEDFKVVFSRPKDVIIGCIAQFTLMPFLAWALTQLFHLPTELAIGVILVGTCPGGTSSNVMTYLSKGDVALSVGMTAVSTVLAPFLTPLLTLLYAGQRVDVNPVNMFLSIVTTLRQCSKSRTDLTNRRGPKCFCDPSFESEIIGQVINSIQSWIPVTAIDFMVIEAQPSSQGERIRCSIFIFYKNSFLFN